MNSNPGFLATSIACLAALTLTSCAAVEKLANCPAAQPPPPEPGEGVEMVAKTDATCLAFPVAGSPTSGRLAKGDRVVVTRNANDRFQAFVDGEKWCGWVDDEALATVSATGTRGLSVILAPVLIMAGTYIVGKLTEWLQKKGEEVMDAAVCELAKVVRREGERVLVEAADGTQTWMEGALAEVDVSSVKGVPTDSALGYMMEGGAMPEKPAALSVEARVRRKQLDGELLRPGEPLRLGDRYSIEVRCSHDCYVRITTETPGEDGFCQYYPNSKPGYTKSQKLASNRWTDDQWSPNSLFEVGLPLGAKDVIRIEANTYQPYLFVPGDNRGDDCQTNDSVKSGSMTRGGKHAEAQPQAEAVRVIELPTQP